MVCFVGAGTGTLFNQGGFYMSAPQGYTGLTPNGFQSVSGMGGFGGGTGFGMDALLILLLLGGGQGGLGGWGGRNGGPATAAVTTDVVLQPAFQALQGQITNLQENLSADAITGKISDLSTQLCASGQNLNATNNANTRELAGGISNLATATATGNFTTLQSLNGLQAALTQTATQNLIQGLNQSQITNGLVANGFNNQTLATLTGFNATEKSIDVLAREMAKCCCETQQAIERSICAGKDNTQTILSQLSHDRMADLTQQLQDAKNQISDLNQTNALIANNAIQTSTILQHLAPFCYGSSNNGNGNGNSK